MKEHPAIIAGASISGLALAKILSGKGIDFLIVEKESEIGASQDNKIDVAEVRGFDKYVKKLGLKPVCVTHKSRWHSPNNTFELELKDDDSYFFRRGISEDSIENQLAKGVEEKILFGAELIEITRKEGHYEVTVKQNNEKQKFKAKIIVGADGVNSQVAKLCVFPEVKTRKIAGYGINFTGGKFEPCVPVVYFDTEYFSGGYLYVAPCPEGTTTAIGVVDSSRVDNPKEKFNSFVKSNQNFKDVNVVNEIFGEGVISGPREQTVKEGILLVGDAAHVMDPCFGYGLRNAITTGFIAGEVIGEALEKNELGILNHYDAHWRKELGAQLKSGAKLRKLLDKLENKDFDFIVESLNRLENANEMIDDFSYSKHLPSIVGTMIRKPISPMRLLLKFL